VLSPYKRVVLPLVLPSAAQPQRSRPRPHLRSPHDDTEFRRSNFSSGATLACSLPRCRLRIRVLRRSKCSAETRSEFCSCDELVAAAATILRVKGPKRPSIQHHEVNVRSGHAENPSEPVRCTAAHGRAGVGADPSRDRNVVRSDIRSDAL
jgi:hypothetical protein